MTFCQKYSFRHQNICHLVNSSDIFKTLTLLQGWDCKKDEDSLAFGRRCLLMARNMLEPDDGEEPHQELKRGYRR